LLRDLYTLWNTSVNRRPGSFGFGMTSITKVVIGGFGNVGEQIARRILEDATGTLEIAAIAARDHAKARDKARSIGLSVPIISADEAPRHPGVLVECSTFDSFRAVVEPTLRAGGHVIAISVGALVNNMDLIDLTRETGATLQIAGGTLPGLDILRAAREGGIRSVRLTSHIHPASLAHEPYIAEHGIDLGPAGREPVPVFSGSAREAAKHFPRHFNVAVTLASAGVGLDETQVTIRADGTLPGARHTLAVEAEAVELEMRSQNFPSPQNNRTSRIVSLSILAALRRLNGGLIVGS
jgi:aspartate dehydrogenase